MRRSLQISPTYPPICPHIHTSAHIATCGHACGGSLTFLEVKLTNLPKLHRTHLNWYICGLSFGDFLISVCEREQLSNSQWKRKVKPGQVPRTGALFLKSRCVLPAQGAGLVLSRKCPNPSVPEFYLSFINCQWLATSLVEILDSTRSPHLYPGYGGG